MVEGEETKLICRLEKSWMPEIIEVKKMGGETNRNFMIKDEKGKWVVRIPWGTDSLNRKIEAQNIIALKKSKELAKILPNYRCYLLGGRNILLSESTENIDLPDGTVVTEYIEGQDLDVELLNKESTQKALVETLYIFHTSGVNFVNKYNPFQDEILKDKNEAKQNPLEEVVEAEIIKWVEEVEEMTKRLFSLEKGISTHNDLILGNLRLRKDGTIHLLDFEYAGFNVRGGLYYDFGTLLGENLFYEKPLEMEAYKEILDRASLKYGRGFDPSKAYCGALINVIVTFWWGLAEYFRAEKEERKRYFKDYFPKRIPGIEFLSKMIGKNF